MINIFIGYDTRESIASDVCEFSIKKRTKSNLNIQHLKLDLLKKKKIYTRKEDKLSSTEFTFSRFLIPYLMNYKGWAIFCDCDFLWLEDIEKLYKLKDEKYAVMCCQHDYKPKSNIKMDGKKQLIYPRKNWSSMVMWNCGHPSNKILNRNLVNTETGKFLHRFGWLKNEEIGNINIEWNWLVNWYKEPQDGAPKALHFTEGGPWFENFKNCEYSNLWFKEKSKFKN